MVAVVIDPGHGGGPVPPKTGGSSWNNATGPNGTLEKTLTLEVGLAAAAALSQAGVACRLTRDKDVNLGIVARAKVAKDLGAAAFVSIHFNAAPSSGPPAQGTETWVGTNPSAASLRLAQCVQQRVRGATGLKDRGVKVGNVSGVIKNTNHNPRTAHCLVEVSFIDRQPREEERLLTKAYVDQLGQAVCDGIRDYLSGHESADGDAEVDIAGGLFEVEAPDVVLQAATTVAAIESDLASDEDFSDVPFIDDGKDNQPFSDLGRRSSVDNPDAMLKGWTKLEVAVAEWNTVQAALLAVLAERRRAVCRIVVPPGPDRIDYAGTLRPSGWRGTGFLVSKNILLTNHHVLNSIKNASDASAEFDYEVAPADLPVSPQRIQPSVKRFRLDPSRLFVTSPATGQGLDYTFVWIEDGAAAEFGAIEMQRASFTVDRFDPVFVIHHPQGRPKEASLDDTETLRIKATVLHYAADTDYGSSGSPVFDRQGRLIALHHARNGDQPDKLQDGRDVDVVNEGIKISAIGVDLENAVKRGNAQAAEVLACMSGSDTLTSFFGGLGRSVKHATSVEAVVDVYTGTEQDVDIGFWNIEWLANRWRDPGKLDGAATVIADLNLDIWALSEVSPPAIVALVERLQEKYGERFSYAFSEPDAPEAKQSTAVIWKPKLVAGERLDWPDPIDEWWQLDSRDDLPFEAVDGKIFNRYPGLFRFSVQGRPAGAPFDFNLVPLHLKAMAEGAKRRRLAAILLARAVGKLVKDGRDKDWIIGGDVNDELASGDFDPLSDAGFKPMSAADEEAGAFTYLKSPKSLIDNIFVSANVTRLAGGVDYFIVAKEKSVDGYIKTVSDHRPVVLRVSLGDTGHGPGPLSDADLTRLADRITSHRGDGDGARPRRRARRRS